MEKIGLVLEGGAMRGMFSAGVTDVLMENKIEFDGAIGVSAGATFGNLTVRYFLLMQLQYFSYFTHVLGFTSHNIFAIRIFIILKTPAKIL